MTMATVRDDGTTIDYTPASNLAKGDLVQIADGRAGVADSAISSGARGVLRVTGTYRVAKTSGIVILAGGRVYWDHSASAAHYKKVDDQDFYVGRALSDAGSSDTVMDIALNAVVNYDIDIARDASATVIVGTQALGGLALNHRGGSLDIVISSTSEAQKVDALARDGFSTAANAIVEFTFCVNNDGAGTVVDVSIGVASATHATDADSIAQHLFMHLDANNTAIRFQSKDGTHTVASTDSTTTYTEGATASVRVEVWLDMRDPTSAKLYVNGAQVLSGTTFDVSSGASTWYPLVHVEKTSAADAYEISVDSLKVRLAEK